MVRHTPEPEARSLLCRYRRNEDGSLTLEKPYVKNVRDDHLMLTRDCLAFEYDLSKLTPARRDKFLSFERAYTEFYRVWTGSCAETEQVSRLLDSLQAGFERVRSALRARLSESCCESATGEDPGSRSAQASFDPPEEVLGPVDPQVPSGSQ